MTEPPDVRVVRRQQRQIPKNARAFQKLPAGFASRLLANVVDAGIVVAIAAAAWLGWAAVQFLSQPVSFSWPSVRYPVAIACCLVLTVGYFTASWVTTGRTYGDHLLGLRVVSGRGRRLGWATAFLRAAVCVLFPLGLLWCVVSPRRRSVADVLLRTQVRYDWIEEPGA